LTAIFSSENDNYDKTENVEHAGLKLRGCSQDFSVPTRCASSSSYNLVGENNCELQDERNKFTPSTRHLDNYIIHSTGNWPFKFEYFAKGAVHVQTAEKLSILSYFINYSFVLQAKVYSQKRKLDIVNRVSTRQQWKPNQCRLLILRLCATAPAIPWWQWHCRRLVHRPTTRNILSSNLSLQFCSPE